MKQDEVAEQAYQYWEKKPYVSSWAEAPWDDSLRAAVLQKAEMKGLEVLEAVLDLFVISRMAFQK